MRMRLRVPQFNEVFWFCMAVLLVAWTAREVYVLLSGGHDP